MKDDNNYAVNISIIGAFQEANIAVPWIDFRAGQFFEYTQVKNICLVKICKGRNRGIFAQQEIALKLFPKIQP